MLQEVIARNDIQLAQYFVGTNPELAKKAINLMTTNKNIKHASRLIEKFDFNPEEFPDVMLRLKKVAARYFINSDDMGIYHFAELISDDPQMFKILIEDLEFKCM